MTWLDFKTWEQVQRVLPIVVVDVVPLRRTADETLVGLIRRETPHQGLRWNLVGGRMRHGETLGDAVLRELRDALGDDVRAEVAADEQPHYVAQYAPSAAPPFSYDPRKHAVGLTYALAVAGEPAPRGEAVSFAWFRPGQLPPRSAWGFEQDRPAEACLRRAGLAAGFAQEVTPWPGSSA